MITEMNRMIVQALRRGECPLCKVRVNGNVGEHIKKVHGEEEFKKVILKVKRQGIPDPEIGDIFGITFRQLEKIITEAYGINISVLKKPKKVKYWHPRNFKEETTTYGVLNKEEIGQHMMVDIEEIGLHIFQEILF